MFKVVKKINQMDLRLVRKKEEEKKTFSLNFKDFYSNFVKQLKENKLDHKNWIIFLDRWCDTNLKGNVELYMNPKAPTTARATTIYIDLQFEKEADLSTFKSRWV